MASSPVHPHDLKGQQRAAAELAEKKRIALQLEVEDVKWQMGEKAGRRVVARLVERAGALGCESLFNPNAMTQSHDIGRLDVVSRFRFLAQRHCPDLWNLMLEELEKTAS